MDYLLTKSISIFILFVLCTPFVRAQDRVQPEQTESDTLQTYIKNAQYKEAVEYIDRLELTKELLYQKSLCFRFMNDYSSAIDMLNTLSAEYPDDVPVKLQLAICYEAIAQYPKSIDCYNQLLRIDSTNTYFEVRKADLLYRSEKYALSLDAYSRIDSTYNANYVARCMAMCYEKLNQPDKAKDYYAKAWELDARDVFSANSLVKIYLKKEDYVSAYDYSEKFIKNDSSNLTMNALNAFACYNLNYYDIAICRFKRCLQQGDSSLIVNRSLGFSYYLTDKDSLARPLLQQAFLQDTTNNNVLYILGKVNYKLGYYQDAVDCFLKMAEKITPSNTLLYTVYKELAMASEKNGEFRNALSAFEIASRYASDNNSNMELSYAIANLYENELMNYSLAVVYYRQYRLCLFNYQNSLKDDKQKDIDEIEGKLSALDKHIDSLMVKSEK